MALSPYCSNDEVRATLGVSALELGDQVLDLPMYTVGLQEALLELSPTLPAAFSSISAIDQSQRTEVQNSFLNSVHLFSVYSVAKQAGVALSMLSPRTLSDEKSSYSRFSDGPYKDTLENIEKQLAKWSAKVVEAISLMDNVVRTEEPTARFVAVKRRYDPVTGSIT